MAVPSGRMSPCPPTLPLGCRDRCSGSRETWGGRLLLRKHSGRVPSCPPHPQSCQMTDAASCLCWDRAEGPGGADSIAPSPPRPWQSGFCSQKSIFSFFLFRVISGNQASGTRRRFILSMEEVKGGVALLVWAAGAGRWERGGPCPGAARFGCTCPAPAPAPPASARYCLSCGGERRVPFQCRLGEVPKGNLALSGDDGSPPTAEHVEEKSLLQRKKKKKKPFALKKPSLEVPLPVDAPQLSLWSGEETGVTG